MITQEQAMKAHRGSRGIAVLYPLTSALDGMADQLHVPATLPRKQEPVHHSTAWWVGAENLAHPGLRSRTVKHVALRYPGPFKQTNLYFNTLTDIVLCLIKHHSMKTWGSSCIAPQILDFGTRWTGIANFTIRSLYPR